MSNLTAKRYTEEDIDRALQAFATQGNDAGDETGIPIGTIRGWAYRQHRDKYQALRDQRQAEEARELAVIYADVARQAATKARAGIDKINLEQLERRPEILAQAVGNLAKTASTFTDKMQVLRDRPTQIVGQVKTVDELDQAFRQRFGAKWDVESTAEEVESAA